MKRLFAILIAVVLTTSVFSQSPNKMSYQAVVRNASGQLIKSSNVGIRISILQATTSNIVYQETQTPATNANGLISIEIGGGTVVTGIFADINWATGPYFIKTETDPAGGTNYTISGTSQLLSVPYALYAKTAGNGFNGEIEALIARLNRLEYQTGLTVKDADGNLYNSVTIGEQIWLSENLRTTKFNDSSGISKITDNTAWNSLSSPAYCWYNNDSTRYKAYGALYNGYTINSGNLCPVGWHVPTDSDFKILEIYLGMTGIQADSTDWRGYNIGSKLKESGTIHWRSPNNNANNMSAFTALPGGFRSFNGLFDFLGNSGFWWTSSYNYLDVWYRKLSYDNEKVYRESRSVLFGLSVRCVKD